MDADKIVLDLSRRFSAPLPEFYKRRIVFWYDEEQKFTDQIDEITLDGVKIVKLTGSNLFAVERLLTIEDTASNYLVYCPVAYESPEKNWLLNIELYSGSRSGRISTPSGWTSWNPTKPELSGAGGAVQQGFQCAGTPEENCSADFQNRKDF